MMSKDRLSRREFMKGSAISAVSIAALGLSGCGANETGTPVPDVTAVQQETALPQDAVTSTTTPAVSSGKVGYEIINTDFLVVGSGNGAVAVALIAAQNGKRVTVIDKGPYGHSGASGFNWDCYGTYYKTDNPAYLYSSDQDHQINAKLINAAVDYEPWRNVPQTKIQQGEVLPARNADGTNKWYFEMNIPNYFDLIFVDELHFRTDTDYLKASPLITIADRTMATDVILNNGRCVGVSCLYLPTGDFRVYRAPVTVLATGGCCQFFGWTGVSSYSINSMDNTGDLDMALFRHGAGIGHAEFCAFDFFSCYPKGLGFGWGTGIDCDGNEPHNISDKDGNPFFNNGKEDINQTLDRCFFDTYIARKIHEGGVLADDGKLRININNGPLRPSFISNLAVFEKFGINPYKELIPAQWNMFEHQGQPVVHNNFMTEFPGLIHQRGAGSVSPAAQTSFGSNIRMGPYAAKCALDYVDTTEPISEVDWTPAELEFYRLQELLDRDVENPLRPCVVRHQIQEICGKVLGLIRSKADMEAALQELARIRGEDLPRICVATASRTYNTDWKDAIETYNLMDEAEISVKAALVHEETRGQYLYTDFPEKDDANWNCMLVARKNGDEIEFTKENANDY